MWTLECDGGVLDYKRIWLRPGKKYLFGRTQEQRGRNAGFKIDHKSVSRQHLTLTVSNVKPGDGSLVHTQSEITLKDEATKFGTEVDGDSIKNDSRLLKGTEHTVKLGNFQHIFRIKWQPVVLTFSLSSKETKSGKDPLVTYRSRLEDLDVKVIIPYVIDATTHVVSSKRNTAKGLQALINGKYIVHETYIDALVYATTPEDLDELESLSPLEKDFDGNWPDAMQHLPAKSKEPSERPAEDFAPQPQRANVFEGYTFVFCDSAQFESLHAPIANGGGKALQYTLEPGKTTAEDIVRYVKSVAGEKGLGEFEDGSEGRGVVVVKFRGKKEYAEWAANLDTQVALALDLRLIEQSEFLDAILTNDASMLRRPLPRDDEELPTNNRTATQPENVVEKQNSPEPEAPQFSRRARARGTITSRFKGFDDDDDDDIKPPPASQPAPIASQRNSGQGGGRSRRHANGTSFSDSEMDVDSQNQTSTESQAINPRKRAAPSPEEEDEEAVLDRLLPAAAAMKRRKIQEDEEAQRNGVSRESSFGTSQTKAAAEKPKKSKKEINIKEVVRERREAAEQAARHDEETLRDTLDGMNVEQMKNLAVVEEMQIPDRADRMQRRDQNAAGHDDRWDERWNGRKNFKKFRRQGQGGNQARRGPSVIVPLEEVKKKDFGIGEDYWLETENSKKSRKERERATQSQQHQQSQSQSQSQPFTTARSQAHAVAVAVPVASELAVDDNESRPDTVDVDAPRATRHQERTQQTDEGSIRSHLLGEKKRPAASQAPAKGPPAKKQKVVVVGDSDSDSEDELKFRFKKRI